MIRVKLSGSLGNFEPVDDPDRGWPALYEELCARYGPGREIDIQRIVCLCPAGDLDCEGIAIQFVDPETGWSLWAEGVFDDLLPRNDNGEVLPPGRESNLARQLLDLVEYD